MNDYELTPEQIKEIKIDTDKRVSRAIDAYEGNLLKVEINKIYETGELSIARLARKKLVEWLRSKCYKHYKGRRPLRYDCFFCLQSLRKELEVKS